MPTQTCSPWPNATWRLGLRAASKRSGSGDRHGRHQAPVVELDRPVVAQHLLDRAVDQRSISSQGRQLRLVLQQGPEAVAEQVGGGLVAGVQEKDALVVELRLGEPLAVFLALDEARQDVGAGIARSRLSFLDEIFQEHDEIRDRPIAALKHLRRELRLEP
jgi:hypothetical protein